VFSLFGVGANAQLLLRDDFNGAQSVNSRVWRLPFGGEGTFVGRTQFQQTTLPTQGINEPLALDGKVTEIHLDTYSAADPGNQFLGTDLLSKRNFARGGGLTFEARMRLKPTTVGGLVNGFFAFDTQRDVPPGTNNPVRDEIDWELLSNQGVAGGGQDPFSNYWNDGNFSSGGSGQFHNVAGLDLTQFQNYKVEWTPAHVKWFVNNQLYRTQTSDVPDDPMKLHFNLWAPDIDFAQAYNAALVPTDMPGQNQRYSAQVDHIEVNRINTIQSANLLVNPSFEIPNLTQITPTNGALQGTWLKFGNAFIEADDIGGLDPRVPDMAVDGIFMAKMFGPFRGAPDASGVLQNVPAQPGQEFEARVFAQTASGDSILGRQNFNTVALSFLNSSGNVIEEAFGSPNNVVPKNGKDFPLLDGRDTTMPQDTWVEGVVNAKAPAGTVAARISLFFVQLANEGGASWFDAASLVRLTPDLPQLVGDFDGNGVYNCADINSLTNAVAAGGSVAIFDLNGDNQLTIADVDVWRSTAGNVNLGSGRSFPIGDANLDGLSNGADFSLWDAAKFTNNTQWCSGNFNADLVVDGVDFGLWNANRSASSATSVVPEPTLTVGLAVLLGFVVSKLRSRAN
jgi:hypothetical protein